MFVIARFPQALTVLCFCSTQVALYNKMEKADILDMAVKYIKAIRTHPEVSTTNYRQVQMSSQENSTSFARNYEIPSPTPLQPRTDNVIYDNSYPPPKEIVNHATNCSRDEEDDKICAQTSRKDGRMNANEQFDISRNENTITTRNEQTIPKSEIPRIQTTVDRRIWRPW